MEDTANTPPEVVAAQSDEAKGIDPAAAPAPMHPTIEEHESLQRWVDHLSDVVYEQRKAVALILKHLDPNGTSHSFDALREG